MEEVVRATGPSEYFLGVLGHCYAAAGRQADALRVLDQLQEASKQRYISTFWQAAIHSSLGNKDEAFRLLDAAYQEHAPWMAYPQWPFFDGLQADPRFDNLLRRMKYPAS
jgi:hypothetical protein